MHDKRTSIAYGKVDLDYIQKKEVRINKCNNRLEKFPINI